jgi:non-lysosomal glucosylceramidase
MAHHLGDQHFAEKYKLKFTKAKAVYEAKLWNGSYFNYDSGTSSNSRSIQADQLAGQWYTASSGLPPLFDEHKIRTALQKIFEFNVMKVKGGRMGAVNGMTPKGKVDETCMQSREIWTGVTYAVAANMLLHGMEHQGFTTAEGIFIAGWSEEGYGYALSHTLLSNFRFCSDAAFHINFAVHFLFHINLAVYLLSFLFGCFCYIPLKTYGVGIR